MPLPRHTYCVQPSQLTSIEDSNNNYQPYIVTMGHVASFPSLTAGYWQNGWLVGWLVGGKSCLSIACQSVCPR